MVDCLVTEGFHVQVIDNLRSGRLGNLRHHTRESRVRLDERDLRTIDRDDAVFRGAEYLFHFAGIGDIVPSVERPTDYMSVNVMGTVHALEGVRHAGVRKFVYAASSSCYGVADQLPTTEHAPIRPEYPYALSKYQGEQAVLHWGRVYRLPTLSIRIFNAYGPRCGLTGAYGAVFGVFLPQKLTHKPYTVVGDGKQTRDWVYATDVARAFLRAAESERVDEVYNLGSGAPQSVNRLVELLGGDVVHLPKRPGEPDCTWADVSKIRRELGWEARVSLEEGVAAMLAQIETWRAAPVWDRDSIDAVTKRWFEALTPVKR
jgi:UDP-glucose 4-epimerase